MTYKSLHIQSAAGGFIVSYKTRVPHPKYVETPNKEWAFTTLDDALAGIKKLMTATNNEEAV